jgi:hypothetical protein
MSVCLANSQSPVANMAYVHRTGPTKSDPLSQHFYYVSQKIYNPITQAVHELRPDRTALATATVFRRRSTGADSSAVACYIELAACYAQSVRFNGIVSCPTSIGPAVDESILIHQPTIQKVMLDQESIKSRLPCQLRLLHPQGGRQPQKRH